jgi:AcrR family transcriptional regulator
MNARSTPRRASAEPPRRRREEARDLFRKAILDAAEVVFAEHGFQAARIQDIAKRARIGVGTVYNHFARKEEVLGELLDERSTELIKILDAAQAADTAEDYVRALSDHIGQMLSYVEEHRGFFIIVMSYGMGGPVMLPSPLGERGAQRIERFRSAWMRLVQLGVACGALQDMDVAHLGAFLGGTVRALLASAVRHPEERLRDKVPVIVDLFLHGAARRQP